MIYLFHLHHLSGSQGCFGSSCLWFLPSLYSCIFLESSLFPRSFPRGICFADSIRPVFLGVCYPPDPMLSARCRERGNLPGCLPLGSEHLIPQSLGLKKNEPGWVWQLVETGGRDMFIFFSPVHTHVRLVWSLYRLFSGLAPVGRVNALSLLNDQ